MTSTVSFPGHPSPFPNKLNKQTPDIASLNGIDRHSDDRQISPGLNLLSVYLIIRISFLVLIYETCFLLSPSGLESPSAALGAGSKGDAELEETEDDGGEVLEEEVVVLGVLLDPGLELLVLDKSHIGGKHHQGLGGLVLVLKHMSANLKLCVKTFM